MPALPVADDIPRGKRGIEIDDRSHAGQAQKPEHPEGDAAEVEIDIKLEQRREDERIERICRTLEHQKRLDRGRKHAVEKAAQHDPSHKVPGAGGRQARHRALDQGDGARVHAQRLQHAGPQARCVEFAGKHVQGERCRYK